MDVQEIPTYALYQDGVHVGFGRILDREFNALWNPLTDIDWTQEVDGSAGLQEATTTAATSYHFLNLSGLLLCGRILQQPRNPEEQQLSLVLAFSQIRNIDAWGRYIGKMEAGAQVHPRVADYYRLLFAQEDNLSILIGMETLGSHLTQAFFDRITDVGDPIFQELVTRMLKQLQRTTPRTTQYLRQEISTINAAHRDRLRDAAATYQDRTTAMFDGYEHHFQTVDEDPDAIMDDIQNEISQFYQDIGLA